MQITVNSFDLLRVERVVSDIRNGYEKVVSTAINKTAKTTKVQSKARIGNELNLSAKRIDKNITIKKASYAKLSGAVVSKGKPVGLIQFSPIQKNTGISVKVLRSGTRKIVKHAFIAKGKGTSTTEHMYMRKYNWDGGAPGRRFARGRRHPNVGWGKMPEKFSYKIMRLTGPRIEDIFAKQKVIEPITIQANKLLADTANKEIGKVIERHAS